MGRMFAAAMALLAGMAIGVAQADEVYSVFDAADEEYVGDLIYEIDIADTAVWITDDGAVRFYVEELGGVYNDRSVYEGWFIEYTGADTSYCGPDPVIDHEGTESSAWGSVVMIWDTDESWVMEVSECDEAVSVTLIGELN